MELKSLLLKKIGSHPTWWWLRALAWAVSAIFFGPLCLGAANAVAVLFFGSEPLRRLLLLAAVQPVGALAFYVPLGVLLLPAIIPSVLIVAMVAPWFPIVDRWLGIIAITIVLSSFAAGVFLNQYYGVPPPQGYFQPNQLLLDTAWIWFTFATGLLTPRLLFRWLRPGSFLPAELRG